jgi:hypothetical protein
MTGLLRGRLRHSCLEEAAHEAQRPAQGPDKAGCSHDLRDFRMHPTTAARRGQLTSELTYDRRLADRRLAYRSTAPNVVPE